MSIESEDDLIGLLRVGKVVGLTLREMEQHLRPGMTTAELDAVGARILARYGARSAPHLIYGFPGVNCISVNDEAVHGIPGTRVIRAGDMVKMDVTAELGGYIADAAVTVVILPVAALKRWLCVCAEAAFHKALGVARAGRAVNEIGRAVESEVQRHGFMVLRELNSHGVGRAIHEEPTVPNYYDKRRTGRLSEGLVLTIEPIIATSTRWSATQDDGWTIKTADGSLSAHYEHTVVITRGRPIVLTAA